MKEKNKKDGEGGDERAEGEEEEQRGRREGQRRSELGEKKRGREQEEKKKMRTMEWPWPSPRSESSCIELHVSASHVRTPIPTGPAAGVLEGGVGSDPEPARYTPRQPAMHSTQVRETFRNPDTQS